MAFNINAQVILSGPKNLKQITKKIGSEFRKASNVKLNVAGGQQQFTNISKRIKGVSSSINKLNANLRSTSKSIAALNSSFSRGATSVNNIAKAQSKLQASAVAANTPLKQQAGLLKNVGSRFASVAKQAVAFGLISRPIYDLQRAFVTATKDAVKFEKEIVKISQVTGQTVGQLDSLKSTINSLASSLGANANELAETARIIAQTGKTAQETELILKALARSTLAPTFGKLTDTTEGLVAALAQFNLQAKDSEAILGALNRVSKNFAVEAEDLVSVIRRTGGVFAQAAGDSRNTIGALEELISIFTAVRSTTRESADTIAAGLRTIFSRIQRKSTIDFLKNFGVELTNVRGEFIGLFPAFDELSNKLSNLIASGDALTLSQIAEELGGIRQIGKLLPAIAQFEKARDALGQAQQGALEGLSGDVTKGLDTIDNRIKRVKESFSALIRDVFDTPAFQTFSKSILSVSENLIKFGGSFVQFIEPLLPLITTLGAIKISRSLTSFIGGGAISSFFGSITGTATASNTALTSAAAQQTSKATSSTVSLLTSQNQILSSSNNLLNQISSQFSNLIQINNSGFNTLISSVRASSARPNVITGFAGGARRRSGGGKILGFNRGGMVPGTGNGDTVPAMLEPGEFVIKKSSVNSIGAGQLASMNKYADGGKVTNKFGAIALLPIGDVESQQGTVNVGTGAAGEGSLSSYLLRQAGGKRIFQRFPKTKTLGAIRQSVGIGPQAKQLKTNVVGESFSDRDLDAQIGADVDKAFEGLIANTAKLLGNKIGATASSSVPRQILNSVGTASTIGSIFEGSLSLLGAPFDRGSGSDEQDPFDFPSGIGSKLTKAFPSLANLPVEAKRDLTNELMVDIANRKATNFIGDQVYKSKEWQSLLLEATRGPAKTTGGGSEARRRRLGFASGGGISGEDTIPALLTPGEFVFNKKSAERIGYGTLNKMNKQGVTGFNKGGTVGVQRFQFGGEAAAGIADPRGANIDALLNEEKNARKKNNDALKNNTKQLNKAKLDINNLVGAVFALQFAIGDIGRLFSEGEKTGDQLFSTLLSLTTTFALLGSTVPWKTIGSGLAKIPGAVKNIPQTFKLAQNSVKGLSKALVDSSTRGAKFGQALTGYGKIFIDSGAKLSKAGNTVAGGIRSTIGKGLQGIGSKGAQLVGPRAAGLIGTAIGSSAFAALSAGTFYIPIGNAIGKVVGNKIDSFVFGQREEVAGFKGREGQGDAGAALSGALREGFQGAGLGAGIGATIGSIIAPGIGTAIGAAIGAGAGAIVGTITGAINGPLEQAAFQSAKNYLKAQDEVVKSIEALSKGFSLTKFDKFLDDFLASGEAAADAVSTFKDKFENEVDLFGTVVKSLVAPITLSAVVITKFTNAISMILSGLAVGGLGDISGGFVSDVSFSPDAAFEAFNDSLTEIAFGLSAAFPVLSPLISIFSGLEAVGKNLQQRGISFDETFNRAFELLDKGFEQLGLFEPSVLGLTKTIDNAVKNFAAKFEGAFDIDLGPAGKQFSESFNLITENFGKFLEGATFGLLGDFTESSSRATNIDKAFKSFETIFDPKKAEAARRALSQGLAKLVEIGEIDVADLGLDANIIEGVDFKRLTQIRDGLEAQLDELDPGEFEGTAREFRAKQQALQQQLDFANEGLEQLDLGRNIIQGIDARIEAIGDATDPEVQRLKKILQGYNQVFGNQLTQSQKLLQEQGDDQTNFLGFGGGAQKDAAKGLRQLNFEIQQGETSLADLTDEQIEAQARAKTNSAEARQLFIQQAKAARDAALADAEAAVQQGQLNALLRQSNAELNKFVKILSESGDRLNKANAESAVAFENAANAAKIFEGEVAFDRTVNPFEFGASGAADRQSSITTLGDRLNRAGVTSVGARGNFVEAPRRIETDNITNFLNVIDNASDIAERTFNELQEANVDGGQINSKDVSNAFISNIEDELGGVRLGQPLRDSIISKIEAEYNREGGGELGIDDFKRRVEEAGGIVEFLGPRFQEVFDAAGRLKAAEDLLIQNAQTYAQSLVDAEKNRIEAEFKIIDKLNQVRDFIVDPESNAAKQRNRFGQDLNDANFQLGDKLGELGFGPNVTGRELQAEIAAGQANAAASQAAFDAGSISAEEFARAQADATTQVANANQALNLLANDTTRLAAIQKEAGKLIQRRDEARGLADTFVTAQLTGDIAAQSRFEESRRVASDAFGGGRFGGSTREAQERAFLRAQEDPQFAAIFAAQARSQGFEGETSQDVLDAVRVRNLREEASRAAAGGDTSRAAFLNQLADDIEAPGLEDLQKEANRIGNEQVGLLRIIAANQAGVDQEQITAQLAAINAQQQVVADETQTLNDTLEDVTTPATPQQPLSVGAAGGVATGPLQPAGGAGGAGGVAAGTLQPVGGGGLFDRVTRNASQGFGLLADAASQTIFGQPVPQSATQQIPLGANQTVGSSVIDQALERQEELINQQAEQLNNFQVAFGENVSNINNAASSIETAASVMPNQVNISLPPLEVANTDAIGQSVAEGTANRLNPLLQNALNANQQNAPAQGSIDGLQ